MQFLLHRLVTYFVLLSVSSEGPSPLLTPVLISHDLGVDESPVNLCLRFVVLCVGSWFFAHFFCWLISVSLSNSINLMVAYFIVLEIPPTVYLLLALLASQQEPLRVPV